jgi:hypothetical protein
MIRLCNTNNILGCGLASAVAASGRVSTCVMIPLGRLVLDRLVLVDWMLAYLALGAPI